MHSGQFLNLLLMFLAFFAPNLPLEAKVVERHSTVNTQKFSKTTPPSPVLNKKNLNKQKNKQKKKLTLRPHFQAPKGSLWLRSAQALVLTEKGDILFQKNAHVVQPIASITKLMTAMVVLDAGLDMDEIIEISEEDVYRLKNTRSRLKVGTQLSRSTALLLALMSSENRAASALGRHYPGGLEAFIKAMNKKSKALGMKNTYFVEPTGLSSANVSNAFDLSKMVLAAAKYPLIRYFSTMGEADIVFDEERIQTFHNTNALIDNQSWQIGISKTGYIAEAGRCLVMQAVLANKPVVIVLLDSVGKRTREGDANRIKTWMEYRFPITAMNHPR